MNHDRLHSLIRTAVLNAAPRDAGFARDALYIEVMKIPEVLDACLALQGNPLALEFFQSKLRWQIQITLKNANQRGQRVFVSIVSTENGNEYVWCRLRALTLDQIREAGRTATARARRFHLRAGVYRRIIERMEQAGAHRVDEVLDTVLDEMEMERARKSNSQQLDLAAV